MADGLKQAVLDNTHDGLDILLDLYPSARDVVGTTKKFKMRPDEKTASATIRKNEKGIWVVHDFGSADSRDLNCFNAYMYENNIAYFTEALHQLANMYNVDFRLRPEVNKATIEYKDIEGEDVKEKEVTYEAKDKLSEADKAIFGPFVTDEVLKRYNYKSLKSFSIVYRKEKTGRLSRKTIYSNDNFPIFLHECGDFQKIYCPLACDDKVKKFTYSGTKPKDYINGMEELKKAYERNQTNGEGDDRRLEAVIICSGERDAMNVAGMGYYPIWLNSESARLPEHQFASLRHFAKKIYNIPDIDATGVACGNKLALDYMDLYTIELPKWLLNYRDCRGKQRKDLRDFLELHPSKHEFEQMIDTAMQSQFWSLNFVEKKDGSIQEKVDIKAYNLLYFLRLNGFYKLKDQITGEIKPCRIRDYKVEMVEPKEIRDFVRTKLLEKRKRNSIMEAYINSKKATQSIYDDLETVEVKCDVSTPDSRTLFFEDCVLKIYKERVERIDARYYKGFCYKDKVLPHKYKELPPAFHMDEEGHFYIDHTQSKLFCYLINGSRMSWREELENRVTGNPEEDAAYAEANKFTIYGDRLTQEEMTDQLLHLTNKIYAYGFLLHHFKREDMAKCVWVMESKLTKEDESSGGSGKSVFMRVLDKLNMAKIVTLQGRSLDINSNSHFLDRVDTSTDILFVDDATRNFPLEAFYSIITGQTTVNPKGTKSFEIDYKDSPQMVVSSNFPWRGDDRSTMRRLLPVVFSDYYHDKRDDDDYREIRKISDDFDGKMLMEYDYTEEEYNADYNFLINCIQFYLAHQRENYMPPMEKVMARVRRAIMGDNFASWADVYFAQSEQEPNENLDHYLKKSDVFNDFDNEVGRYLKQKISTQGFKTKLKVWCKDKGYEFNPEGLTARQSDGRLSRKLPKNGSTKDVSTELIYIRSSQDKPLNEAIPSSWYF